MKLTPAILCAALLVGCSGRHPKGTSRYDPYDAVKVDQMVGNNVSQAVMAKTIVCLNARRESRRVTAVTNTLVTSATNQVIHGITNQTISIATNLVHTYMTNLAPALPTGPLPGAGEAVAASALETNALAVVTNLPAALATNLTVSLANNFSGTISPSQRASNQQQVRTLNHQLTTTSNNVSIALMTNLVVTAETNVVVTYATNTTIVSVTNYVVVPTNLVVAEYYLYAEMIPPADFTLASGESLVLLVDGVRYAFTAGPSGAAFVARKGFASTLYRVPPEVLVAIANAREVRVRFRGVNSVIERSLSGRSRQNFREFLARYFAPEKAPEENKPEDPAAASKPLAATDDNTRVANR